MASSLARLNLSSEVSRAIGGVVLFISSIGPAPRSLNAVQVLGGRDEADETEDCREDALSIGLGEFGSDRHGEDSSKSKSGTCPTADVVLKARLGSL